MTRVGATNYDKNDKRTKRNSERNSHVESARALQSAWRVGREGENDHG